MNTKKLLSLIVILVVTFLLFNPGFILGFVWVGIEAAIVIVIMNLVSKLFFKKTVWELLNEKEE